LESADASVEGFNPMCGDRLTVRLKIDDDKISDIRFEGQGCAISTASASLMTEAVKGRTRAEALRLFERIHELLTDDAAPPADELGKLAALSGVREYPARVKCASLCWHTLASALRSSDPQALPAVTTE
jgi:nitrogen fixation NifU-like protein